MSANRAVQAAQRRRAGGPEPAPPGRGPQPSINSSQMFSQQQQQPQQQQQQQVRPGTSGRLAGQHAQQMQQQQQQQMQDPQQPAAGIAGISKMTLAQAITLITLRLGKVETQLHEIGHQQMDMGMSMGMGMNNNGLMDENGENMALVDKGLIDSIMSRLESLEKRSPSTGTSSPDVALLKQQFDGIKMSFAQSTKVSVTLTKEQKEHKQQIDALKSELSETKELLNALQTLTMDNSQKIFAIMSGEEVVLNEGEGQDEGEDENDADANANTQDEDEDDESELAGTDLKGLIEQELNA